MAFTEVIAEPSISDQSSAVERLSQMHRNGTGDSVSTRVECAVSLVIYLMVRRCEWSLAWSGVVAEVCFNIDHRARLLGMEAGAARDLMLAARDLMLAARDLMLAASGQSWSAASIDRHQSKRWSSWSSRLRHVFVHQKPKPRIAARFQAFPENRAGGI